MALAYLFEPTTQFQARTGANLTAGFLKVFYTQTDDAAPTYSDFAATPNEEEIVLDADGRAVVIVDDTKTYRLEVYNRNSGLLFTIDPITAMGGGGGGSMVYRVISTDGTVAVETTTSGGITYYDLSTAFTNVASNWGFRGAQIDSLDGSNDWQELPTVSTMGNVPYSFGWKATKDTAYDFAASVVNRERLIVQSSDDHKRDKLLREVIRTIVIRTSGDSYGESVCSVVSEDQKVDAKLYARCAEALTGTLVGRVFYNEECDGIIGGGDSNYTAGEFVEITPANVINVTGVQPQSAMSSYVQQSAFENCCTAMSGYVSSLSSQVSSLETSVTAISSTVSGLTGTYVEISSISGYSSIWNSASAVSGKLDESAFTAYTSTAQGFTGVTTDSTLTGNGTSGSALGVNRMELVFDSSMSTSISGGSAIVGVNSAIMSGKLDNSASSTWYPYTGNPSGFLTAHQELTGYVEKSSISAKSSTWNSASAISAVIPWSALSGDGTSITGISGSAIGGGATGDYVEKSATEVTIGDSNTAVNTALAQGSANSARQLSFVQGWRNSAWLCSMAQGGTNLASSWSMAQGSQNTAILDSLAQGNYNSAEDHSFAQGARISASGSSMAQGYLNSAFNVSFAQGKYLSAVNTAAVFGINNLRGNGDTATGDSAAFVIGDGWLSSTGRHDLMVVTKNGEITMFSSTADTTGTGIMSSIRAISAAVTGGGGGATGDYVEKSATEVAIGSANSASATAMAQGVQNIAETRSFAQGYNNKALSRSFAQGAANSASSYSFAQGFANSALSRSVAQGYYLSAKNTATAFGQYNLRGDGDTSTGNSAAFVIGDGTDVLERHDLMLVTKNGEITMFSSTADTES